MIEDLPQPVHFKSSYGLLSAGKSSRRMEGLCHRFPSVFKGGGKHTLTILCS